METGYSQYHKSLVISILKGFSNIYKILICLYIFSEL